MKVLVRRLPRITTPGVNVKPRRGGKSARSATPDSESKCGECVCTASYVIRLKKLSGSAMHILSSHFLQTTSTASSKGAYT